MLSCLFRALSNNLSSDVRVFAQRRTKPYTSSHRQQWVFLPSEPDLPFSSAARVSWSRCLVTPTSLMVVAVLCRYTVRPILLAWRRCERLHRSEHWDPRRCVLDHGGSRCTVARDACPRGPNAYPCSPIRHNFSATLSRLDTGGRALGSWMPALGRWAAVSQHSSLPGSCADGVTQPMLRDPLVLWCE